MKLKGPLVLYLTNLLLPKKKKRNLLQNALFQNLSLQICFRSAYLLNKLIANESKSV